MYILKNAWKSITRTKSRNILLGIVIFVIGVSCCVSLSINSAAENVVKSKTDSAEIIATFNLDRNSFRNGIKKGDSSFKTIENISRDKIVEVSDSDYVKFSKIVTSIGLNIKDVEPVSFDKFMKDNNMTGSSGSIGGTFKIDGLGPNNLKMPDFEVVSYNISEAMTEFINGTYKISEGEIIDLNTDEYTCNINSELAEDSGLKVGDSIVFTNPNNEEEKYTFVIKGIYEDTSSENGEGFIFSNSANKIIIPEKVLNKIVEESSKNEDTKINSTINSSIVLKNFDSIEPFKKEVEEKGLPANYVVQTNEESVLSSVKPIQNLSEFTNVFLIVVLLIGAIILIVLNMINIRERKYEIGVLRAIGMKKVSVIMQFMMESLIVTFIAILVSSVAGSLLSVPISNQMLKSEIESIEASNDKMEENFGGGMVMMDSIGGNTFGNNEKTYVEQINASLDITSILKLFGIGIVLSVFSSMMSMIVISRYDPLKILSSRS